MFDADFGAKFLIDRQSIAKDKIHKSERKLVNRYNLKYYVSKTEEGSDEPDEKWVEFKFEAVEFPDIYDFSWTNPEIV